MVTPYWLEVSDKDTYHTTHNMHTDTMAVTSSNGLASTRHTIFHCMSAPVALVVKQYLMWDVYLNHHNTLSYYGVVS